MVGFYLRLVVKEKPLNQAQIPACLSGSIQYPCRTMQPFCHIHGRVVRHILGAGVEGIRERAEGRPYLTLGP